MHRTPLLALLGALLLASGLALLPRVAHAATITVTTTVDEYGGGADCSLREAIEAANTDGAFGGCMAGSGADIIELPSGTFTTTRAGLEDANAGGDFDIISAVTIRPAGAGPVTLHGGGMDRVLQLLSGSLTLEGVTVTGGNAQGGQGGGIAANTGVLTIRDTTITGNGNASFGGGAWVHNVAPVLLERVTVSNNAASITSGGVHFDGGVSTTIRDSLLTGNSAPNVGALSATQTAVVQLESVTVTGNRAPNVGGMNAIVGGRLTLINVTAVDNGAVGGNSGSLLVNLGGTLITRNTLVADSFGNTDNCVFDASGTFTSLGSNLSDDASCTADFTQPGDQNNVDPLLGPLQNNGGPTQTYALQVNSPAIDGVVGACPVSNDQRGVARPKDGNADGVAACDIGAYEAPALGRLQFTSAAIPVSEGAGSATITVERVNGTEGAVSGAITPSDGTATAPGDYVVAVLPVSFADGESGGKQVALSIVDDALDEPDETVNLALTTSTAVLGSPASAILTILDDHPTPALSIADVSVAERNSGTVNAVFTVTLSAARAQTVSVTAQTADGTATVADGDYQAAGPTVLTFTPGETSKTFTVVVNGDAIAEPDETFLVNLTAPVNATTPDPQATGTIENDEAVVGIGINNVTVTEGDSGSTNAVFTLTLTPPNSQTVTVQAQTADRTATAGSDYVAAGPTTITFPPLSTSQTFTVQVRGDTQSEPNETFVVNLSNPVNAAIGDGQGVGTITDDDTAPSLSVADVRVTEGHTGSVAADFTVSLSAASGQTVTVTAQTSDGAAKAGEDYSALPPTTVTLAPGAVTQTVRVMIVGDFGPEPDEDFFLALTNASNATIGDGQARGVIVNDDEVSVNQTPDDDDDDERKETEEQRQQRQRTNRGNKDDVYTEGNVLEVHQGADPPYVVLGNRDGPVTVILRCGDQCPTIRVGDYLEVDGEKQHEQLFEATDVTVKRR